MAEEQQTQDTPNRRQYKRVKVRCPVRMEATLRGRFIDIMRLELTGATIDVSNGGFCANVDQSLSPGVRCRVEIDGPEGTSHSLWGRVRRTTGATKGYVVALEFDEPMIATELLTGSDNGHSSPRSQRSSLLDRLEFGVQPLPRSQSGESEG